MTRLSTLATAVALLAACGGAPDVQKTSAADNPAVTPPAANAAPEAAAAPGSQPVATAGDARDLAPVTAAAAPASDAIAASNPAVREITIPAGTVLPVDLETPVGSDISRVEQRVEARLRQPLRINGVVVLPAGTPVNGHVTAARRPGKVKGVGYVAMRFTELDTPGTGTTRISSATIGRSAPATKQTDTVEILGPAAAGAVIGRIAGGKGAARKGAVIGGAAGTGYVLSTRGKEVRLAKGANLSVRLTAPVTVRVR